MSWLARKGMRAPQGGGGPLFFDSFDGEIGDLNTHTSNSGHTWSQLVGEFSLNGDGAVYGQSNENVAAANGISEPDCTLLWNVNTGGNLAITVGGAFRMSNANNMIYWDDYSGELRLYKKVAGSYVFIALTSNMFTVNTNYEIKVILLDTSIKVYLNDVLKIDVVDEFNKTVGTVGIRTSFASSGTGARILDMSVTV